MLSQPAVVDHACNPSYLGGGDQEDCDLRPARKRVSKMPSQPIKAGHACHSSYMRSLNRSITVQGPSQPGHKCETLLKKYLMQKGLGVAQVVEFKP
jgi:hypothetical protein